MSVGAPEWSVGQNFPMAIGQGPPASLNTPEMTGPPPARSWAAGGRAEIEPERHQGLVGGSLQASSDACDSARFRTCVKISLVNAFGAFLSLKKKYEYTAYSRPTPFIY